MHRIVFCAAALLLLQSGCWTVFQVPAKRLEDVLHEDYKNPDSLMCATWSRIEKGILDWSQMTQNRPIGTRLLGVAASAAIPRVTYWALPVALVIGERARGKVFSAMPFGRRTVCGPRDLVLESILAVGSGTPTESFGVSPYDAKQQRFPTQLPRQVIDVLSPVRDTDGCVTADLRVRSFLRKFTFKHRACPASELLHKEVLGLMLTGKYSEALAKEERVLAMREEQWGIEHPGISESYVGLADIKIHLGRFADAEEDYLRALSQREAIIGQKHPGLVPVLNAVGAFYLSLGELELAQPYIERASQLSGRHELAGKPERATAQRNIAAYLHAIGRFQPAEVLYRQALAAREKAGEDHGLPILEVLQDLGRLYVDMADFAKATDTWQQAKLLAEKHLPARHPRLSVILEGLAAVHAASGDYGKAEALLSEAIQLTEGELGRAAEQVRYLRGLIEIYILQGKLGKAESSLLQLIALVKRTLGENHPTAAAVLLELARLHIARKSFDRAVPALQQAQVTAERSVGVWHPQVAEIMTELARVHLTQKRPGDALPILKQTLRLSEGVLHQFLTESRLLRYLGVVRPQEELAYTLLLSMRKDATAQRLAAAYAFLRKGRTEELGVQGSQALLKGVRDAGQLQRFQKLRRLRTQLAQRYLVATEFAPTASIDLSSLEKAAEELEQELSMSSEELRKLPSPPGPDQIVEKIARQIPQNGVLLEYIRFQPQRGGDGDSSGGFRYLLFALFPDEKLVVADLGPADPIDNAIARFRGVLRKKDSEPEEAARELYRLVLGPVGAHLADRKMLWVSPDGPLNLVPFAALHTGQSYLIDTSHTAYLTSGRDLLRPLGRRRGSGVVIFADPNFHGAPVGTMVPPTSTPVQTELAAQLATVKSLPGTRDEALRLVSLFPNAQTWLGDNASESAFLSLTTPRILHVATHGHFLDVDDLEEETGRGISQKRKPVASTPMKPALRSTSSAALARSVLVLAGAAHLASYPVDTSSGERRDGLVTALEVANMDLRGTELVTLSACETGKGHTAWAGQGVYGLRRSFIVAGAETLVTSLWRVDDQATSELMAGYYRNLLLGQGRAAALETAALGLRQKKPHPYYWAPFVAIGRADPLRP